MLTIENLAAALILECFEAGSLGSYPDKLIGLRIAPEEFDHRVLSKFTCTWNAELKSIEIRPKINVDTNL